MTKDNYYIDPEEMKEEIVISQKKGQCSERLGQMLLLIADKVLHFTSFRNYKPELKEDMKSYSIMRILKRGLLTVNPDGNPFSYFTTAFSMNYLNYLKTYYRHKNREREYLKEQLNKIIMNNNLNSSSSLQKWLKELDDDDYGE